MTRPRRSLGILVRVLAIVLGLWGGWLAAGAMNDHRIDIPRRIVPATRPSPGSPSH
ncbi:MAG: hypothetical protein ABSB33_03930 [Tepidisphaeraceae bacterium]